VSVDGMSNDEYKSKFHEVSLEFSKSIYSLFLKSYILFSKVQYDGVSRGFKSGRNIAADASFGAFHKCVVGNDQRLITWNSLYYAISSYFLEHFPDIDYLEDDNAKYPYEFITLEYLVLVYKMDERLDILKLADKKKFPYAEFYDYVLNYICCYNEEHGEKYYLSEPSQDKRTVGRWLPIVSVKKDEQRKPRRDKGRGKAKKA